jgi:hypothetical protein
MKSLNSNLLFKFAKLFCASAVLVSCARCSKSSGPGDPLAIINNTEQDHGFGDPSNLIGTWTVRASTGETEIIAFQSDGRTREVIADPQRAENSLMAAYTVARTDSGWLLNMDHFSNSPLGTLSPTGNGIAFVGRMYPASRDQFKLVVSSKNHRTGLSIISESTYTRNASP